MDTAGARDLAARLRAGVKVGTTIMLESADHDSDLVAGDIGVVREITQDGVVVQWERGFSRTIDPAIISYRALA